MNNSHLGLLASGLFEMDPATTPRDATGSHGQFHNLSGALVFSFSPANCCEFARRFRADPKW